MIENYKMSKCAHKNVNTVEFDGEEMLECLDCGALIPTEPISNEDLSNALLAISKVIEHCKEMYDDDDASKNMDAFMSKLYDLQKTYEVVTQNERTKNI